MSQVARPETVKNPTAPLAIVNDRAAEALEMARLCGSAPTPAQLEAVGFGGVPLEGGATVAIRLAWDHLRPLRKALPALVPGEPDPFAEQRAIFARIRDVLNLGLVSAAADHALAGVAVQAADAGLVTISHEGGDR